MASPQWVVELARLGHVTRARLTQITKLLQLAPDIQEAILCLPRVETGHDRITERDLRSIVSLPDWRKLHRMSTTFGKVPTK